VDTVDSIEGLIKPDNYQVFVFSSPANIPVSFGIHVWFVLNNAGHLSRWEVSFSSKNAAPSWGHLCKDLFPPLQGMRVVSFWPKFWKSRLLGVIEGDKAKEAISFIENSYKTYPYCYTYSLIGPNSNTYAQWVLNTFPDFSIMLPFNAFGKKYPVRIHSL
jgi:hypothetical protein